MFLKFINKIKVFLISFLTFVVFSLCAHLSFAAGDKITYPQKEWSFSGITGTFDRASQQRGLQVYKEVCSGCHGLRLLAYRNLKAIGYNDNEVKAFAAENNVNAIDDEGEIIERPARPSDKFVSPYPNQQSARAANGGAYPPDLSLIVKARSDGANYLHALLTGYVDAPTETKVPDGMYYNKYYSGNLIGMPQPLYEDGVTYADGTKATQQQMAKDVTAFLAWASEPELEERKKTGIAVMLFLFVLTLLSYFAMKKIWAPIKNNEI
ncbi:cytochrome c1 [Alphaproteobacteria bacterium]|nr:cytochrome c1 [Alphaproteobacteria bacterium]MDC1023267.1 cytochrome c1 [Alphaproteobacteria bacterium]